MSSHHTNPRSLLNAATRSLIERVERAGRPPMAAMTPLQARAFYDIGGPMLDLQPAPHVDRVHTFSILARDGHAMPARLYAPQSDVALPVLLYIHGGGFSVPKIADEMVYVMEMLDNLVAKDHIRKDFCHETHVVAPRALVWFRATPFFHI